MPDNFRRTHVTSLFGFARARSHANRIESQLWFRVEAAAAVASSRAVLDDGTCSLPIVYNLYIPPMLDVRIYKQVVLYVWAHLERGVKQRMVGCSDFRQVGRDCGLGFIRSHRAYEYLYGPECGARCGPIMQIKFNWKGFTVEW